MVDHLAYTEVPDNSDHDGFEQHVLLYSYNQMLTHNVIEPGAESPYHNHPHEQIGYVVSGTGTQIVDGEEYELTPGTCYLLESGEKHAMRADGDEPLEVLDIFHPVREDYIPE
ncbi:cupin domain-containing protein [Haloparvum sedimenti]|uniref:cupin domain-containing protein n=1 Tax=Haloparvum sedimenti TaxID=1678448 RepID=UPI00071E9D57|nr:cupin domain-containing protein [Haloparvum sedimenti]